MSKSISGAEYPLSKIFSHDFDFHIPPYQRPYAWGVDQATVLFDDLYGFWEKEKEETYFLGSIVLIKEEGKPTADVVDGQQRLTTLTILLAVLASNLSDRDSRKDFENFLVEPGSIARNLSSKPRLALREGENAFFQKYIQGLQIDELIKLDPASLGNDAKRNILGNAKAIHERFSATFGEDEKKITAFGQFLAQRCFLVVVSTPNDKSAFRVFSVMNNRGLDLLPTDILKADAIGSIPKAEQENYTVKWEAMEETNGRDGFNDLFGHIRMIFAKEKARKSLLEEFPTAVKKKGAQLIDEVLMPYSIAFSTIQRASYKATADAEKVNTMLKWLSRVNFSDWMPAAIQFLSQKANESAYCAWFFQKLERLTACLHITGKNVNQRIERYAKVLTELEQAHSFDSPIASIELSKEEMDEFLAALSGDVYELNAIRRNYVMLRLDSFLADGAANYNPAVLTIEHVLPQTVEEGSPWLMHWPGEEERQQWIHKIGNLVPLNKQRNSAARNYEFGRKKDAYFKGTSNVSSYALTSQVISQPEWTPAVLKKRQEELLSVLADKWGLKE